MHKRVEGGAPAKGWNNATQIRTFYGRRGALVHYYNEMVLPACKERFPKSKKYGARRPFEYKRSDPEYVQAIPPEERNFTFWPCVTWREVLRDCRHIAEKQANDTLIVNHFKKSRRKTRVVIPRGHKEGAVTLVMAFAIAHVFDLSIDQPQLSKEIKKLQNELLLDRLLDNPVFL